MRSCLHMLRGFEENEEDEEGEEGWGGASFTHRFAWKIFANVSN